jgi:hypothetical protein
MATPYLEKSGEPRFHVCDEPFAYAPEPVSACLSGGETPEFRALGMNLAPHDDPSLVFEYRLPVDGYAGLYIYDAAGECVGKLSDGRTRRGVHAAAWKTRRRAPGTYYCRLRSSGFDRTWPIRLV